MADSTASDCRIASSFPEDEHWREDIYKPLDPVKRQIRVLNVEPSTSVEDNLISTMSEI